MNDLLFRGECKILVDNCEPLIYLFYLLFRGECKILVDNYEPLIV